MRPVSCCQAGPPTPAVRGLEFRHCLAGGLQPPGPSDRLPVCQAECQALDPPFQSSAHRDLQGLPTPRGNLSCFCVRLSVHVF